ncbi:putative disease resistance RPP13-like protein 1 [Cannabis sativa]|uniref:putative disease resistance RPP13-like protein 1 n=1 Tax=Cannabis sativa TaxID=3483 RepID=UPI0029CA2404|nr:putative disease resistance RPP13-like protein 1 [Cannabis sativa]
MAVELVAGALLSASLQVLFERLASQDIPQLFQGKKPILKLLDKLNTRMLSANKLLNDAEDKQLRDDNVKQWLFKLQDVIYQADDLVDMIDYEALRSNQSSSRATKVFHQLKSVSPLLSTFDRTVQHDVTEILLKLDDLLDQKDALGLREGVRNNSSQRPPAPLVEESDVYGRHAEKETIVDLLLRSDDVDGGDYKISVIPIVGMGGVGKTTLAQLVYDDVRVIKHFEIRAWVTVSDEFDISKVTREIFEGVTSKKCDLQNPNEIRRKLKEALQGKKFMFVLDDVWNESYSLWNTLRSCFESGTSGSKIVVTTRSENVASTMATREIHQLHTLLDDDCWQLFVKHAFRNMDDLLNYKDLEILGRKIVDKCKGLPLAIVSLGGLLRSERNVKKWEDILKSDTWEELYKKEGSILPALWLSYRHLPGHLKRCFAFCSIFPKDYEFERKELILLWMAEGFLQFDKKSKKLEEHGEEYLEDLLSRSLFQHSKKIKSFLQMHDLVHDLAVFVSNDFGLRLEYSSNDLLKLSAKTRHLSYMKKWEYDLNKFKGLHEAQSLRTFLALPFQSNHFTSNKMKYDMLLTSGSCLRVLSLCQCSMKKLPHSIGNLKHLRYLDLSFTPLQELPDSVCNLYNLQTLLLYECWKIRELPKKMGRLINLRYLDIDGVPLKDSEFPQQLSTMKHLSFLSNVVLSNDRNSSGGFEMKKVGKLENLRCISGLENIKDGREASEANLKDKKYLSELTLKWDDDDNDGYVAANSQKEKEKEKDILDALRPHTNLEHLRIVGYRGSSFSEWIGDSAFAKLVSVSFINCKNCCVLPPLGQLPFLKQLNIRGCDSVISIGDDNYKAALPLFSCLESLTIADMMEWKDWSFSSEEAMQQGQILFPLLKWLELSNCPKLDVGLPGCYLPSLEKLHIWKCEGMVGLVPRTTQHTGTGTAPSLVEIHIEDCLVLESLLGWGSLHSKLKKIELHNSKRLFENHKQWDLHRLSSLESLHISGWEAVSFPYEAGLPTTLTKVNIWDCSKLETLNNKAFQQLTSLQKLYIKNCPRLRCLPEEGLPSSLSYLKIRDCPLLKQQCEKEKGEDWPKIQHITKVTLDDGE